MENKEPQMQDETIATQAASATAPVNQSKAEKIAAMFAEFKGKTPEELSKNRKFLELANQIVDAELANLPEGKFLEQRFERGATNSLYSKFVSDLFGPMDKVVAGKGIEFILNQGMPVNVMDKTQFIPTKRTDADEFSFVDSITIPDTVHQVEFMGAPYLYIDYFLSGKVEEYIELQVDRARESLMLKVDYDAIQVIKAIFAKMYALNPSTDVAPTAKVNGTANYYVDAIKELADLKYEMSNHNQRFAYNADFTGYNNLMEGDERFITTKEVYNNLVKVSATFLSPEKLSAFADQSKWLVVPEAMFNPATNKVEKLDIFVDSEGNRVKGAVLIIGKSGLKRANNLDTSYTEFFPKNMTTVYSFNARYAVGILGWTQVGLYVNEALEQSFYIATKAATETNKEESETETNKE